MKKVLVIVILILTNNLFSQKNCVSKEGILEDLNTISKCRIAPIKSKKYQGNKILNVRLSNRKRYLDKKRATASYLKLKKKRKQK